MDKISEDLQLAAVCSEDQKFLDHEGFDFEAIEQAIAYNKKKNGKKKAKIRGGSTISQQCAKNVFLFPHRSWLRKGLEAYFTFWIELLWSKERILTCYLNVIEMGDGVYGAEAAAQTYFHKKALELSASESATIVACLPNPRIYHAGKPSNYILKRRNWIMRQMSQWGDLPFDSKN
jgi:monofunctional biosynthetic peptidoglycan transglycosylase